MDGNGPGTAGALNLTSVTINNNQADHNSGGVFNQFASISYTSVTNTTNIGKAGPGGALSFGASTPATLSVSSSTFTSNESRNGTVFGTAAADVDGGAIAAGLDTNTGTISNTNFTNNISFDDGGSIRAFKGAVTVSGGTMSGNTARDDGGAVWGDIDTVGASRFLTLSSVTIRGNTANSDSSGGGDGGAIFRDRGTMNVSNCFIGTVALPNTAVNGGGIAHAYRAGFSATNVTTINVDNGSIVGNNATTTGGGTFIDSTNNATGDPSDLNIGATSSVLLSENNANVHGGGVAVSGGANANLTRAFIHGNDADKDNNATGDGGGVYTASGTVVIPATSSIGTSGQGNTAENGGAIHHVLGTLTITGVPLSNNTTDVHGGGLSVAGGTVNVNGVTFAANTSTSGTEVRLTGGTTNFLNTVTIPGELSIAGGTLVAGSSTVNLGEDFHFTSGTFTAGTSTFNFNGAAAQQIYGGSVPTFNILTDANTAAQLSVINSVVVGGNLTINANAILNPSAAAIVSGAGTLTGSGTARVTRTAATADFLSQYTITNKTLTNLTVDYAGAATQTANALTYGGLRISNAAGVALGGNATVNGNMGFVSGNLTVPSANTLTLSGTATSSRTSGHLIGKELKTFSGVGSFTYHVGTANGYSPVTANVTAGSGSLTIDAKQTAHPNVPNPASAINRFWTLSGSGITTNLTFNYLQTDVVGANENIFNLIKINGGVVSFVYGPALATFDRTLNTATLNNVSSFSDWTLGEAVPTAASASINGRVLSSTGRGLSRTRLVLTDSNGQLRYAMTNPFGYYRFTELAVGNNYVLSVSSKLHQFKESTRLINLQENLENENFIALP